MDKDSNRPMGNEERQDSGTKRPQASDPEDITGQGEDNEEFEDTDDTEDFGEDDLDQEAGER